MKVYSTPISNYRTALKEFWPLNLLSFRVKDRTSGDFVWFHFSGRDENEEIAVIDPDSGASELRSYRGGGHILALDPIVRYEGVSIRNLTVTLSAVSDDVLDMLYGYDARDAHVEWHVGEIEEGTGLLVDTPVLEFEGLIDEANRTDEALVIWSEGTPTALAGFQLSLAPWHSVLQRANAAKRTLAVGQERNDDGIFRYADAAHRWNDITWGKGKG